MLTWTGRQIGDFVVEETLGRGGMGVVYAARQRSVEREVALKVIDLEPDGSGDFLKRFTREVEVIANLEHIHILPVYSYGVFENEFAYFAMRLVRHGTLADRLRKGALPLDEAVNVFSQIASGLQYMHSKGIIHRDLKPSNVLLDESGSAFLSDFGLARYTDATLNFSTETILAGSPAYIAPELIQGGSADHLCDIYALGVMLYQMLSGRLPFGSPDGTVTALLYQHVHEKPPPLRQINPAIPAEVEAVVMRALSKNPRERYISAGEMASELRAGALHSPPLLARARPLFTANLLGRARETRRLPFYGLLIACVLALIVLGAVLISQPNHGVALMNVQIGGHGTLASLTVSDTEIARARSQLGQGFIAAFPCTLTDAYQTAMARELSDMAAQDGLSFRLYDSQDDPAREVTLIEQARLDGAKAFILCPLDQPLLDGSIQELQKATIPLVLAMPYDSSYGIKIELDDTGIGDEQGRYAGQILQTEHAGNGTVVVLSFMDVASGQARAQGMQNGLLEIDAKAALIGPLDAYTRAQAKQVIQSLIADGKHFDGILAFDDASALGAIDALVAAKLTPRDVFIVSANHEEPVTDYIQEDYYVRGSVPIDHSENARLALIGIVKALAGTPVPEYLTLSNGTLISSTPSS